MPFVCIQIIMIGLVIGFPGMVSGGLDRKAEVDTSNVILEVQPPEEPKKDVDMNQLFGLPEAASAASK